MSVREWKEVQEVSRENWLGIPPSPPTSCELETNVRFQEVRGDIRDLDVLKDLPDDVDVVVHLAALAGVRPSIERCGGSCGCLRNRGREGWFLSGLLRPGRPPAPRTEAQT